MSSVLTLRKATREKTKMRVALAGPSGSGKTFSALILASGMANWDKIALIDTENGSGDLYSHLGGYSVITLSAPFSPERYIQAIEECEKAGMEVIILDSISHEWAGKGGILETKDQMGGNGFTAWGKLTPRHDAFVQKILQSKCHVIATMRAKQDYVLSDRGGKQVPEKVGLAAVTRDGVEYEFTLVFDLNMNHLATASKDRTGIFMTSRQDVVAGEKITKETGEKILEWTKTGTEPTQPVKEEPKLEEKKPEATPEKKKPQVTQVMEFLTSQKTTENLEKIYTQALTHEWSPDDAKILRECFLSCYTKITGWHVGDNLMKNEQGEAVAEISTDEKGKVTITRVSM